MPETTYTYSIAGDFPGGAVNTTKLDAEIRASVIVIALQRIDTTGDVIDIVFKDVLSSGDKTLLDGDTTGPAGGLIAAHDNTDSPQINQVQLSGVSLDSDNRLEVTTSPPIGLMDSVQVTHNLCDMTTWWEQSVRVTDEAAVDTGDGINWDLGTPGKTIDMYHGKVFDEYHVRQRESHEYKLVVTVNSVEQTERTPFAPSGGDYVFDYDIGRITFASSQAGNTVLVSYSRPNGGRWTLAPDIGKRLDVQYAEAQFSSDLEMETAMLMSIHGYVEVFAPAMAVSNGGPIPDGTVIELDRWYYQTLDNIIEEAVTSMPVIPAIGTNARASTARQVFPFRYNAVRDIRSSYGMSICIYPETDDEWGGTRASLTMYCVERDEM